MVANKKQVNVKIVFQEVGFKKTTLQTLYGLTPSFVHL